MKKVKPGIYEKSEMDLLKNVVSFLSLKTPQQTKFRDLDSTSGYAGVEDTHDPVYITFTWVMEFAAPGSGTHFLRHKIRERGPETFTCTHGSGGQFAYSEGVLQEAAIMADAACYVAPMLEKKTVNFADGQRFLADILKGGKLKTKEAKWLIGDLQFRVLMMEKAFAKAVKVGAPWFNKSR
ncbi:MAG: hypothetical protein FWD15_04925 [Alphaproteobacteria bacterium]|nr:hypothetical protein [Alphaproteobacteria bacterium]